MTDEPAVDDDLDDAIIATLSDYLDNTLPQSERAGVEAKLAADPQWKRAHDELAETRKFMSGIRKAHAPATFTEDVTETIHKRSAGRFFGRKTFGDRVPFGALVIVALTALAVIGYVLWSSSTGSLKVDKGSAGHGSDTTLLTPP